MKRPLGFETNSLALREFTLEDDEALYLLTRQKEITDILPDWNMTKEQLTDFLRFVTGSYTKIHAGDVRILLAAEHKRERKLIGWCGVFPNGKLPPDEREIAYAISKDYRGRGYAAEAVSGMVSYIFGCTGLQEITAIVKPFNTASRRVLGKAGFRFVQPIRLSDGADYEYFVMERSRERS
ncbi:GNAT family N-acetyltransferase [Paenibacillus filicis]|uniref:GNAT family N-acetyltransferase n=1 Tax=Paenibacillus gyeongsangnamensis TaxID=3388067 RepID=A0ABT4QH81_9BACL|nr:GNAT family N-acetyltransferase [Paenibacillus filicis]MCZ8516252.1 GNAT family N-acetyltransferase [Paenibacillus filicis]